MFNPILDASQQKGPSSQYEISDLSFPKPNSCIWCFYCNLKSIFLHETIELKLTHTQ